MHTLISGTMSDNFSCPLFDTENLKYIGLLYLFDLSVNNKF